MRMGNTRAGRGATLVEASIALVLVAVLVGVVVTVLHPARQFAVARNSSRFAHLNVIQNAISANAAEHVGTFRCAAGALPSSPKAMAPGAGNYDIAPCLVTEYLFTMPFDPSAPGARWVSETDYDSGYTIFRGPDGRVTVAAPSAENGATVSLTR